MQSASSSRLSVLSYGLALCPNCLTDDGMIGIITVSPENKGVTALGRPDGHHRGDNSAHDNSIIGFKPAVTHQYGGFLMFERRLRCPA